MSLHENEVERLLRLVSQTRDREVDCSRCLARIAEFAERELAGKPIVDGLRAIEHHLSICSECREEYEALRRALGASPRNP